MAVSVDSRSFSWESRVTRMCKSTPEGTTETVEARPSPPSSVELAAQKRARRKRRWMHWSRSGLEAAIQVAYAQGYANGSQDIAAFGPWQDNGQAFMDAVEQYRRAGTEAQVYKGRQAGTQAQDDGAHDNNNTEQRHRAQSNG